jgi:hypothetical protein
MHRQIAKSPKEGIAEFFCAKDKLLDDHGKEHQEQGYLRMSKKHFVISCSFRFEILL